MKLSRAWAIARKEFFHIYRDPRSLALVILMPALLMLLFGYAVTLDVKKVSMAVLDRDQTRRASPSSSGSAPPPISTFGYLPRTKER